MSEILSLLTQAQAASRVLARADTAAKNRTLGAMAAAIRTAQAEILAANALDMAEARTKGLSGAMLDRLKLDAARVDAMAQALEEVAALPDPVGRESAETRRPNGLRVCKRRVPLGVIAMIYEARPNVTAEAAALTLKTGNAVVLRGGSEAFRANQAIAAALHAGLRETGLPEAAISLMPTTERAAMLELLQQDELVDLVIPRGGEGLIRFVAENSRIPVIRHYKGVCHLYVDKDADLEKSLGLLLDGKTSRPGVCNALESLLVHEAVAEKFFATAAPALREKSVEIRACEKSRVFIPDASPVGEADYAAEFLDLIISVKTVADLDEALEHIARFGSQHTEVIATENPATAEAFLAAVDAGAVMVNASSRFHDGGCLGLGAELGIATTKLHAYGVMGLESLTCEKYIVRGDGQLRHP
ncbi:MAG: glutamate-5-semialdehyde dehydrogenase [Gammaproteobacteria bacterium]|nr:glutamate-5-semialdehyde dehydrogenase [Gammaproteobacteria bacterium]